MLGNKQYCYPLTITDYASRYLISCEALASTQENFAFEIFERAFKEYGIPDSIRTDNGVPFASGKSFYNLTKLSIWWLRHGINVERIAPGHPEQNGRHERMHLTLKLETTRPPRPTLISQQEAFDEFINIYNKERPHEGTLLTFQKGLQPVLPFSTYRQNNLNHNLKNLRPRSHLPFLLFRPAARQTLDLKRPS